jgi:hypothetical protein
MYFNNKVIFHIFRGVVMVEIICMLHLSLPMQSVYIANNVVISNVVDIGGQSLFNVSSHNHNYVCMDRCKSTYQSIVVTNNKVIFHIFRGVVMVEIICMLHLSLPMQSVNIANNVVISNPAPAKWDQHCVIMFVSDVWKVCCFLWVLRWFKYISCPNATFNNIQFFFFS